MSGAGKPQNEQDGSTVASVTSYFLPAQANCVGIRVVRFRQIGRLSILSGVGGEGQHAAE